MSLLSPTSAVLRHILNFVLADTWPATIPPGDCVASTMYKPRLRPTRAIEINSAIWSGN